MKMLLGLIVGGRDCISLGRVSFWIVFGLAVYFWWGRPPEAFPPTLENMLGFLLAYNLGGKALGRLTANNKNMGGEPTSAGS